MHDAPTRNGGVFDADLIDRIERPWMAGWSSSPPPRGASTTTVIKNVHSPGVRGPSGAA
jgi:hypothetical protein